jgi:toxin ParE1/3/4
VTASKVVFSRRADRRLDALYDYIADSGSPVAAIEYIRRIRQVCLTLSDFPERGMSRKNLGADFRSITIDRRVTIVYRVRKTSILIVTIAYAGRDYVRELQQSS